MPETLEPLFARVLLSRPKKEKEGSIIIPDEAQKRHAYTRCTVLATGPTCDPSIKPGMDVLIGRHSGDWINTEGKVGALSYDDEVYICQDEDILAVVHNG